MKKLLALILGLAILQTTALADNDKPVTFSQLPQKAQTFITTYFSANDISYAKVENELFDVTYSVYFTNGNKVEFNKNGDWEDVECKATNVPEAIIPTVIKTYLDTKHKGVKVIHIELDKDSVEYYEVRLADGKELNFNKLGEFLRYDY